MTKEHTFGGHSMDRYLFEFEADDGAAGGDVGALTEAGGPAVPSSDAQASAPASGTGESGSSTGATGQQEPPAPSIPLEVQAELDYLRSTNQQTLAAFQQLVAEGATPQQAAQVMQDAGMQPLDPWADDFGSALDARLKQQQDGIMQAITDLKQQIQAPIQQQQQEQHAAMLAEQVNDLMADNIARHGDFVQGATPEATEANEQAKGFVDQIAASIYPSVAERYGHGPRTLELALSQAADQVRGLLRVAGSSAQVQQANQLATLAGAHGEPGGSGVAGAQVAVQAKVDGESLATKYARIANAA